MPYRTNSELPKEVKAKLSEHQQNVFRNVFSSMMNQEGASESKAFAGAWAQAKKAPKVKKNLQTEFLKFDQEQRIVWGWAYVCKENDEVVYDHSGEWIKPETLEKAATEFMLSHRIGKTMHSGEKTADIVHSMPITKELCQALGIQSNREGWVIAKKVSDDFTWANVKSGKLPAFSIGGRAIRGSEE